MSLKSIILGDTNQWSGVCNLSIVERLSDSLYRPAMNLIQWRGCETFE